MERAKQCILTVNGGSSSIKFALFHANGTLARTLQGKVERIGLSQPTFAAHGERFEDNFSRVIAAPDHMAAVQVLMDWVQQRVQAGELLAVGHRVVHGGPKHGQPVRITPELISDLQALEPFDPDHLPEEILLTQAFHARFPRLTQVACFDTTFHWGMPRVAQLLPIPRRYFDKGVRRYGFHGLSYAYVLRKLREVAGENVAHGRVVVAHLGNGASLAAVKNGRSVDTTMSFTPTAGVPMSTRSGDLDPGLVWYLARTEQMRPKEFHEMVNHRAGLLGVSELSPDMRDLLESNDPRAADAVALFCYQVKKHIGALAAALGGLDTLVFTGGIGERAAPVRARIGEGLAFLGVDIDPARNEAAADIISPDSARVTVRIIPTDEEWMIAQTVCEVLQVEGETHAGKGKDQS